MKRLAAILAALLFTQVALASSHIDGRKDSRLMPDAGVAPVYEYVL